VCTALQGSLNPDYCRMSSQSAPFCKNLAVAEGAGECEFDSDCETIVLKSCRESSPDSDDSNATAPTKTCVTSNITFATRLLLQVTCCADIKTLVLQACTGVDMSRVDVIVVHMRDAKKCGVYPNCTRSIQDTTQYFTSAAAVSSCTRTLVGVVLTLLSFVMKF